MSGHSKWSKVKHQKAVTDVVKAQAFTKAARAITLSVSEGGGVSDPAGNFRLRLAIEKAKDVNMPKENIERAIAKGIKGGGEGIESLLYEAYGPGGIPMLIEAHTENRQRTASQVKNILDRGGGILANQGAVSYLFQRTGVVILDKPETLTEDEVLDLAIKAHAQDVTFYEDSVEVYAEPQHLGHVQKAFQERNVSVNNAEIIYRPTALQAPDESISDKVTAIVDALSDLDDIQHVYTNLS